MDYGLEQVVAAETVLSDVDGLAGQLIIRGAPLDAIAGRMDFEVVVHLLLDGFFDDMPDEAALATALGHARADVFARTSGLLPHLAGLEIYDAVRVAVGLLPDGNALEDALRLIAAPAVLTPALIRQRSGTSPIAPDPERRQAHDVIAMLGEGVDGRIIEGSPAALDAYLVTVCDHGLNASTFAARVVASTRTGLASSVLAGMGALKGPLHGGAPGPVIAMLDAIAASGDALGWLERELASGARLMGFGHRIYRVRDPRADALKRALALLPSGAGRLAFAEDVERTALALLRREKPGRVLETNVEFYTALLLEAIGFPADAFTCVFAMGRTLGWIAHAREQAATGRLIRPQSRYIGPRADLAA